MWTDVAKPLRSQQNFTFIWSFAKSMFIVLTYTFLWGVYPGFLSVKTPPGCHFAKLKLYDSRRTFGMAWPSSGLGFHAFLSLALVADFTRREPKACLRVIVLFDGVPTCEWH